jgi:Domain of unknown function (DUF1963)
MSRASTLPPVFLSRLEADLHCHYSPIDSSFVARHDKVQKYASFDLEAQGMTVVNRACDDAVEVEHVSRLITDFTSREAFAAYSAWLAEHDQAKAAYVRRLVEAYFDKQDLNSFPEASALSPQWIEMIGTDVLRGLLECELASVASVFCSLVRPIVRIEAHLGQDAAVPLGTSKFGGLPDMPATATWPSCEYGHLNFLGQIALAELKGMLVTPFYGLPTDGSLLFFAHAAEGRQPGVVQRSDDGWEEVPNLAKLLYVPGDEEVSRRPAPDKLSKVGGVAPACSLEFREGLDFPNGEDVDDPRFGEDDVFEGWRDDILSGDGSSHMMGYPIHARTRNTSPGSDWLSLLTFGSDDNLGWCWCDGEHLDTFIRCDALANRTFDQFRAYAS